MAEPDKPELIIIRRWSSLDVEEKNGVWKIAYADFMTAMMAFFLVMWLMSATNQETRESVASYFNPIKLTDSTPDRKGINDAKRVDAGRADEGEHTQPQPEPDKNAQATKRPQVPQTRFDEAALFRDPYTVLSEIAGAPAPMAQPGASLEATRKEGQKGGEAFRDPFDPVSWPMAPTTPLEDKALGRKEVGSLPFDDDAAATSEGQGRRPQQGKPDATVTAAQSSDPSKVAPATSEQQDDPKPVKLFADEGPKTTPPSERPSPPRVDAAPAANAAAKLQASISAALASFGTARPATDVRETPEGLLINLTDDLNYGMFKTGSAEPTPGLVRALDKITPLIAQNRGQIIVRGHTDNRAYRTAEYDNWRLSTARAHMAYHMLIRGGLDAKRVERIEGYADRRPKLPNDPSAAQNRRIELLIRASTP